MCLSSSDPNRGQSGSRRVTGAGLPQWGPVLPSPAPPQYKELGPGLPQQRGLRRAECSFWTELVPLLNGETGEPPDPPDPGPPRDQDPLDQAPPDQGTP